MNPERYKVIFRQSFPDGRIAEILIYDQLFNRIYASFFPCPAPAAAEEGALEICRYLNEKEDK